MGKPVHDAEKISNWKDVPPIEEMAFQAWWAERQRRYGMRDMDRKEVARQAFFAGSRMRITW